MDNQDINLQNSSIPNFSPMDSHCSSQAVNGKRIFSAVDSIFAWLCLLAGYAFCRVFPAARHPLGAFLFILAIFTVTAVILKQKGSHFTAVSLIGAVSAIIVSAALIVCANSVIHFFAYAYALIIYLFFLYSSTGNTLEKGFSDLLVVDFFKAIFIMPFFSFTHLFSAAFSGKAKNSGALFLKILLGILLAFIPTITVLILLSYDSNFTVLLKNIFHIPLDDIFSHIGSILLGIPIAMYLYGLFISSIDQKCSDIITADQCRNISATIKIIPSATVLAAVLPLLAIYFLFFISQWEYYISAFSGILPEQFNYAQYAREGFFQLCAVCVINFAVIAAITLFMKRKNNTPSLLLRILTLIISVFTLILISTAMAKMILYINCYGLTPKRVYAAWFMGVLTLLFLLIMLKQFVFKLKLISASVAVCVICFAGLSFSGTDSFIAQYNINRYIESTLESVDIEVMESLGDSAIPHMVRLAQALDEKNGTDITALTPKKLIHGDLYSRLAVSLYLKANEQNTSFFSFTFPRMKADIALKNAGIKERPEYQKAFESYKITEKE